MTALVRKPLLMAATSGLTDETVRDLDRVYPAWRTDLRDILEELTCCDDALLRVLALEAMDEFEEWESTR